MITGTPWTPTVSSASNANHSADLSVVVTDLGVKAATLNGATQAASNQVSFTFALEDLGPGGSISLAAKPESLPSQLVSYPPSAVLVSLVDPNGRDWVNLPAACVSQGFYTASGYQLSLNTSACTLSAASSAYANIRQWAEVEFPSFGGSTTNTFPTCDWANGSANNITTATPSITPTSYQCAFNNQFYVAAKLPVGNYTATYALVDTAYVTDNSPAKLHLFLYKKKNLNVVQPAQMAVDINVIFVGNKTIQASHTDAGQATLNALFEKVGALYSQPNSQIKLGQISVYEWTCSAGGDAYSDLDYSKDGPAFFASGSGMVSGSSQAVNLFFMSSIISTINSSTLTVLGFSGGIRGSLIGGTESNGVAVATFDKLQTMTTSGKDFFNLSSTIGHEMGHYLGLNHPQEAGGTTSLTIPAMDTIPDTPICGQQLLTGTTSYYVQTNSCLNQSPLGTGAAQVQVSGCSNACGSYTFSPSGMGKSQFCPAVNACQFNHVMWWTTQNYDTVLQTGDGTIFSPQTSKVLKFHPYIW